jgi:hypothetical protein
MPYPLVAGSVIQIQAQARLFDQLILFTMHYRPRTITTIDDGALAISNLITVWTDLVNGVLGPLEACQTEDVIYEFCFGQLVYPTRFARVVQPLTSIGLQVPPTLPSNSAAVVTCKTQFTRHRPPVAGQPRGGLQNFHVAGLARADVSTDFLTPGMRGRMATLGNILIANLTGSDLLEWAPVLFHRGNTVQPTDDLVSMAVQQDVRTERRRTFRRGK